MRTARYLVVTSTICTAVALFKVNLKPSILNPFDFGVGDRGDVLPMLVALAVLLLSVSFLLRALTDLLRDREASLLATRYIEKERVKAAQAAARETDDSIAQAQAESREREPNDARDQPVLYLKRELFRW
jgi:hypothetical protein